MIQKRLRWFNKGQVALLLSIILTGCAQGSKLNGVIALSGGNSSASTGVQPVPTATPPGMTPSPTPGPTSTPKTTPRPTPPPPTPAPSGSPGQHQTQTALSVTAKVASGGHTNDPLVFAGYLDVTLYGADPTGNVDSTAAFNNALYEASGDASQKMFGASMVVYVPPGNYLISGTITGYQGCGSNGSVPSNPQFGAGKGISAPSLVGPASGPRPTIYLQAGTFTSTSNPQPMLHMVNTPNGVKATSTTPASCGGQFSGSSAVGAFDILFNTVVRDINLVTGNNPGAIGVQYYSAQMSYMQNVMVDARGGYAGIQGSPATNAWENIEVNGGVYGVMIDSTAGSYSLAGLTLENQTTAGLYYYAVGGLSLAGFNIQENSGAVGILSRRRINQGGQISLVDGVMNVSGANAINNNAEESLFFSNVYVQTDQNIVSNPSGNVAGNGQMQHINEYAHIDPGTNSNTTPLNYALDGVIVLNDKTQKTDYGPIWGSGNPPSNLVSRNSPGQMPWAFDPGVVWVTDYGADETGVADSTTAIRNAVAAAHSLGSDAVFLPRGKYQISETIVLYPNTKFFGLPGGYSQINGSAWNTNGNLAFYVQVGDAVNNPSGSAAGKAILSDLYFSIPTTGNSNATALQQSYLQAIRWQVGANSISNQIYVGFQYQYPTPTLSGAPARNIVQVDNGGGGRWFGTQIIGDYQTRMGGSQFLVTNTSSATSIYGSNIEHGAGNSFYSFINASNIRVLAAKTEDGSSPYWFYVSGAKNVMISAITNHGSAPSVITGNSSNVNINTTGFYASGSSISQTYLTDQAGPYRLGDSYPLFELGTFDFNPFSL